MLKLFLRVGGMHCPNCVMRLESIEETLTGIAQVDASYKKGTMLVEYDEALIGKEEIIKAVEKMGYTTGGG